MSAEHPRPELTPQELQALRDLPSGDGPTEPPTRVDRWFRVRNLYLLSVIGYYVVKLLFFAEATVARFAASPDEVDDLVRYVQLRAVFVIAATLFYVWSYLRNWRFEMVAVVFTVIGLTSLVMDYFNAYMYLHEDAIRLVSWFLLLRAIAVVCLALNAINAARAPQMPRTLWS
jgi:hypothetical protein